ncbi:hypothetical protein ACWGDX_00320 [Streptomyces sp. NPDC055025]
MAVLGLASLLPDLIRRSASADAPETHARTDEAAQPASDKQREEV